MQCLHCRLEVVPEEKLVTAPANAEGPGDPPEPYTFKRKECPNCHLCIGDELLPAA